MSKGILIVDDNGLTRAVLRTILRQDGYRVVGEAKDGDAALLMIEQLQPDVVCLDVMMPKMDGLATLEKIKEAYPGVVVLMITASSDRETVEKAIAAGAAGYVVKPFNASRVLATVEQALRRALVEPKAPPS
jgi:two-component system chemotaxis response regulator CheY